MEIAESRLEWLKALELANGSHQETEKAACIMEAVSYVAGEPWSDHPKCACPVITRLCIRLNDRWSDKRRQALKPFVLRLVGTRSTPEVERRRAFMCADWACRELLPVLFDRANMSEWAAKLRALPEVVNKESAERARDLAREARHAAAADANAYAAADAAADADAAAANAYAYADANAYAYAYADAYAAAAIREKCDAMVLDLLNRLIEVK